MTRQLPELHDRVRYTGLFLHNTGQFTGETRWGFVTGDHEVDEWVTVMWDDADHSTAVRHDVLITKGVPDYTNM